jgi:acetylglutamate kinase
MTDPALREDFARDVVLLKYVGLNPIVVHGGGPDITAYMQRLDMPVEFVGGLRVSDEDTVEIAKMVLVGKVNKDIVMRLNRHGQPAVGSPATTGSCSASRRWRARAARTSASSGGSSASTSASSSTSRPTTSR